MQADDRLRAAQMQQDGGDGSRELPPEIRPRPRRRGTEVAASRKRAVQVWLAPLDPSLRDSCATPRCLPRGHIVAPSLFKSAASWPHRRPLQPRAPLGRQLVLLALGCCAVSACCAGKQQMPHGVFTSRPARSVDVSGTSPWTSSSLVVQVLVPTVSSKQCDRCLAEKATSEFVTDKYSPDGLKKRCKLCMVRTLPSVLS